MLDAFNEIVGPYGEEFREELFRWAGSNEKNGPVFANLTVTPFVDDDDTVIKTVTEVYAGEGYHLKPRRCRRETASPPPGTGISPMSRRA